MSHVTADPTPATVRPDDEHNRTLVDNAQSTSLGLPRPVRARTNMVVIGAGTAGLVTAAISAALVAKVTLIEKHLMDGDCLNVSCAPSNGEDAGFARVHVKHGTDNLVGATIVAAHAGDTMSELAPAMKAGAGLGNMTGTFHPYPTQAGVMKKAVTAWRKTTLTEGKKKILGQLFTWMRSVKHC